MRKVLIILLSITFLLAGCGPKPGYKTAQGRKKNKYYNKVQYGIEKNPTPPKSMTKPKKVPKSRTKKKDN